MDRNAKSEIIKLFETNNGENLNDFGLPKSPKKHHQKCHP